MEISSVKKLFCIPFSEAVSELNTTPEKLSAFLKEHNIKFWVTYNFKI